MRVENNTTNCIATGSFNIYINRKPDVEITEEKLEEFMSEIKTYIKEMYTLDVVFIEPADLKY